MFSGQADKKGQSFKASFDEQNLSIIKVKMDVIKKQVNELMENQNHMLVAIKYLDEKLKEILSNAHDKETDEIKDILESQGMIDGIIVPNSDDILAMKKTKEENAVALRAVEAKIQIINEEIELTNKKIVVKASEGGKVKQTIKCNLCDKDYERFIDLENHI